MGIVIPQSGALADELAKWEQHRTRFVPDDHEPGNMYVYRPYPRAMYKAHKKANGKVVCMDVPPEPYNYLDARQFEHATLETEAFNRRCYREVGNEEEHEKAKREGWSNNPLDALQLFEACEQSIAKAAAEANFSNQRMSEKARDEFKAAEDSTHEHVADVVGASHKTIGSKDKIKAVTS